VRRKVRGDCITLALIDEHFDRFVSTDVLEHLTENDIGSFPAGGTPGRLDAGDRPPVRADCSGRTARIST
jgi:hypothetical protein